MGSNILDPRMLRSRFHDVPDRFRRDPFTPNLTQLTHSPEDHASRNASCRGPLIDGADVLSLAHEVSN